VLGENIRSPTKSDSTSFCVTVFSHSILRLVKNWLFGSILKRKAQVGKTAQEFSKLHKEMTNTTVSLMKGMNILAESRFTELIRPLFSELIGYFKLKLNITQ
jgi:hypothetical protein